MKKRAHCLKLIAVILVLLTHPAAHMAQLMVAHVLIMHTDAMCAEARRGALAARNFIKLERTGLHNLLGHLALLC